MVIPLNPLYLANFDDHNESDEISGKLKAGLSSVENTDLCRQIFATGFENEELTKLIKGYVEDNKTITEVFHLATCAFLKFMDINWNPHPEALNVNEFFGVEWPAVVEAATLLQRDSEPLYVNILFPELLLFSSQIFTVLHSIESNVLFLWWNLRCKVSHQRALEDASATIYSELEVLIAKLSNELQNSELFVSKPRLKLLACTEICQAYLLYGRVQKAEEYLTKGRELAGLKLELTGILGKRTKYQQNALPQLALSSALDSNVERPAAEDSHGSSELPPDLELDDDLRLNKIQYNEKISQAELPSLEQTLCLLTVQYIQKSQPKDDLMREELQPYIDAVLSQKSGAWSTRVATLLIRCQLEATHKRTVERAMLQCEAIVNDKTGVSSSTRLSYLWASGLPPSWGWRQQLADLCLSLGLTKAALEQYRALCLWEDVIVCYTMLQLRHKAAEVIQQQIDIKPTVKLYCLLGDATDDITCYERAWQFSNHRSSRAQRHWGNYLFDRKQYTECIPHFQKSLEINSIQERVWLRLGYAALETEQWEISATAYRRYTYLHPNTFEAWNNLAKVYVQQGDKPRAYRALMEALRFNYDNWKLWENVILISLDTGHFEDVLRGVHRLLDLRGQYGDAPVLRLLARAVLEGQEDADGHSAGRLRKRLLELFGRVTSVHQNRPDLWQIYADLSPTYLLKAQRLLKAYKGFTQSGNWSNNPETCKKVIDLALTLLENSLKARQECEEKEILQANQQLSSARLTGQAVIRAAEKQDWEETKAVLDELRSEFNKVTEYMKSIM
ncbi:hypothetical protein JYU34_007608 [Plutella xylostella]|uniref:Tetratricopeptide repeat protein 27 n=1 Tax=Plutella xylostella TaxID=51655 RepID=A0ABQ7QQU7_PLUXY|nr:hypothetical protein JYU34_007608 [Plutella xylostella]